ncbi:MAG TPA: hypothetical protein PLR47_10680, partial [Smithellaceae bacterium]|nr:hypothetical protein [Smithellaceae bacterium]
FLPQMFITNSPSTKKGASSPPYPHTPSHAGHILPNFDEFVKSHDGDDEVKSSRGKARES